MHNEHSLEPRIQELLEDILSLQRRQARLLEEIRDLLAAGTIQAAEPRRETPDKSITTDGSRAAPRPAAPESCAVAGSAR
jgi:hypothetical protein